MGAIAALIQESNSRNLNSQMRKSLTDMNQVISKSVNPELKKSFDPKMIEKANFSRLVLDPIKPVENAPRTQESPKAGRPQNRQSPSPPASVFGGKSSGFESYRSQVPVVGPLDIIKQRLAYEWKNIFRTLT